jgi:hypothetical protein
MRSPAASWRDALGFRPMTVRSCVIREAPFIGSPLIESIPPQVQPALRGNLKAASPFEASASIRYRGYVEASRYRRRLPAGNLQCLDSRIGHQPRNRRDPVALVTHYPLPHKPTARTGRPAADQQPASASGTQPSQTATPPRSPHSPRTRKLSSGAGRVRSFTEKRLRQPSGRRQGQCASPVRESRRMVNRLQPRDKQSRPSGRKCALLQETLRRTKAARLQRVPRQLSISIPPTFAS